MPTQLRPRGIRKVSPLVVAPVAGAAAVLYQLTLGGTVARHVIIRKIMIYTDVGNCVVDIGAGLLGAFAAFMPSLYAINLFDTEWTEDEIPEVEVNADITVESSIAGCLVQIEVEEIGS